MSNYTPAQLALQAHIEAFNFDRDGSVSAFQVVTDLDHWAGYGVASIEQYKHYMAVECYINVYKDVVGIKPRWVDFSLMNVEQIESMIDSLCDEDDDGAVTVREYSAQVEVKPVSPFAVALLGFKVT